MTVQRSTVNTAIRGPGRLPGGTVEEAAPDAIVAAAESIGGVVHVEAGLTWVLDDTHDGRGEPGDGGAFDVPTTLPD